MAKTTKKQATKKPGSMSPDPFTALADSVAARLDADLLFYNAPVERHFDQLVIDMCRKRKRRTNVALFLVTTGGDADAAYRIAACLQDRYKRFSLFVPGYCKSAGTLIALGAHELIVCSNTETGPLDVQLLKKDELVGSESGLTASTALETLNQQAFSAFEHFLLRFTGGAGSAVATRTVADIAVKITCGLFAPIYQQIDPMHVGEAVRALEIARAYGLRLATRADNLKGAINDSLNHLISHYPSHGFVIDFGELKRLFKNVRDFTTEENALIDSLPGSAGRWPIEQEDQYKIGFISTEVGAVPQLVAKPKRRKANAGQKKPRSTQQSGASTGTAAAATGTGPTAIVAQLPSVQGISKRHP